MTRLAPLVTCCLLASCSLNTGIELPPVDSHVDPVVPSHRYLSQTYRSDYVAAVCDWFLACAGTIGSIFPDRVSCEQLFGFTFDAQILEAGEVNDPLVYRVDETKAAACIQAVKSRGCASTAPSFQDDPNCGAAFVGRLNDGECCDDRGGCGPGMVCEIDQSSFPRVGYCSAQGDFGETCFVQECSGGTSCHSLGNLRLCLVSLNLGQGEPCDYTFDCAPTLACQYAQGSDHQLCLLRPNVGDFCSAPFLPCADGLYCVGGATSRCAAQPGANGEGCNQDVDCAPTLTCVQEVCTALGGTGDPCSNDDPQTQCGGDLACIDGICGVYPVPVAIGDPCHPDGPECPSALGNGQCVQVAGSYKCVAPAKENESCTVIDCDFSRGLVCDPNTDLCKLLPKDGESCPEGLCYPFFTVACVGPLGSGVCHPRKPVGSPCTVSFDEDLIFTECAFFSLCLPDATTGQTVCTRPQASSEAVCQ